MSKKDKLLSLCKQIEFCNSCSLQANRTIPVYDKGNLEAKLLIVGMSPGMEESIAGRPFVGKSGKLLDECLESIGLTREDVWCINSVACWPGKGNPEHSKEQEEACSWLFWGQIDIVKPKVILGLGGLATRALLDLPKSPIMNDWVGKVGTHEDGTKMTFLYHPSFVLRNIASKRQAYLDAWQKVKELLDERR